MAKNDTPKIDQAEPLRPAPAKVTPPALGTSCTVVVGDGVVLMNNDTGVHFTPGVPTPVLVTATTLRRLNDGDLTLAD